ncbi:MAG: hypothetical protein ACPGID_02885, partial [Rubricella sp.]
MSEPRRPVVIEEEDLPPSDVRPATAPPVEAPPAVIRAARVAGPRKGGWIGRVFWAALSGFLAMAVGLAAWDFVAGLLERNLWLGRLALGLGALALLMMV